MSLETATYISDLVPANPLDSDAIAYAASHLRMVKSALQASFPNLKGSTTATAEQLSNGTPVGLIAMWSGATVPVGWTLCNGVAVARMDGTGNITPPDLRNRFIVGSGGSYSMGNTGGNATYQLSVAQLPSHGHQVQEIAHSHGVTDYGHNHGTTTFGNLGIPQNGATGGNWWFNQQGTVTTMSQTGISVNPATTGISVLPTGSGAAIENRPPYYALAFIMKV
jgi:microcystin-dependent protein